MEILTAFLLLVTAVYAYITYRILQANEKAVQHMKMQTVAISRPYVSIDVITHGPLISLFARNDGKSSAHAVSMTVSPALHSYHRETAHPSRIVEAGIAFMPPGKEIEEFLGGWHEIESENSSLKYTGVIKYSDSEGTQYEEPFTIDLMLRKGLSYIRHDTVEKELQNIDRGLKAIAHEIASLKRS